jgi:hypothetical protein
MSSTLTFRFIKLNFLLSILVLISCADSKLSDSAALKLAKDLKECKVHIKSHKLGYETIDEATIAADIAFQVLNSLEEHTWVNPRNDISIIIHASYTDREKKGNYYKCISLDENGYATAVFENYHSGATVSKVKRIDTSNKFLMSTEKLGGSETEIKYFESLIEVDVEENEIYRTITEPKHFSKGRLLFSMYEQAGNGHINKINIDNDVLTFKENGVLLSSGQKWCEIEEKCPIEEKEIYETDANYNLIQTSTTRDGVVFEDVFHNNLNKNKDWTKKYVSKSTHLEPYGYADGYTFLRAIEYRTNSTSE